MIIQLSELRECFGFGVAGNFAGHLEQAGEAADFTNVGDASMTSPKGIFPFYVPRSDTFLGAFPLSHDRIAKPQSNEPLHLQIEPEIGLLCAVEYAAGGAVARLLPEAIGAFNDCSIRRPGAKKISEKKNWGADSKGFAQTLIEVDEIDPAGATKTLRIASFLQRGDETSAYGVDSPAVGYSFYGERLLEWMVDRLNHQQGGEDSPLEPVGDYLRAAGSPARALIGIGATRYTPLGETTFLDVGDQSIVVIYDGAAISEQELTAAIASQRDLELAGASVLRQLVVSG